MPSTPTSRLNSGLLTLKHQAAPSKCCLKANGEPALWENSQISPTALFSLQEQLVPSFRGRCVIPTRSGERLDSKTVKNL
ncbi:hypothetical protein H8959_013833 [Pygathrix nigripes]